MAIDWTQIIITLLGVFTSCGVGVLATLKYAKNKAKTDANSAANQEQSERIDLGDKYVTQMLAMLEKLQEAQDKNIMLSENNNSARQESWGAVTKKMEEIHDDLVGVKSEVSSIVMYLNGGYRQYKAEHKPILCTD